MMISRIVLLMIVLSFVGISCISILSHPHQVELQAAYERSRALSTEAQITLDTSRLSEGFTQKGIDTIENVLKYDTGPTFISVETKIDWLEVVEYNPPEAIIKVKYFYRGYTYNRETREIRYGNDPPRRYWRIEKYRMVQEDGIWKFDEFVDFVDWSG